MASNPIQILRFQSTPPVWGGTPPAFIFTRHPAISIHPPRVGRDLGRGKCSPYLSAFQSTLPVWGGTGRTIPVGQFTANFNPPSPCGEGLNVDSLNKATVSISIHPPRVGRDSPALTGNVAHFVFQSTLPVWGGTQFYQLRISQRTYFNPPSPCGEGLGGPAGT